MEQAVHLCCIDLTCTDRDALGRGAVSTTPSRRKETAIAVLTSPTPDRAIQLESYRLAAFREGHSEQLGSAYVGDGIGAAVLREAPNDIVAPDTMPIVVIMALSTRRKQNFDLLGRRTTAPLPSDTVIIIPQSHQSWWASREPMRNLHVHIQRPYLDSLGVKIHDTDRPQFGIRDPLLARLGRLIEASLSDSDGDGLFLDHLLLAYAVRVFTAQGKLLAPVTGGLSASAARRCIDHLEARLADKVTIRELAAIAGLSQFHFVRMFQRSTGHPPVRYQQRLRMEKAKSLLSSTDMPVKQVAAAVGYDTPSAFARAFRAHTGVAPSRWRAES